MTDSPSYLSYVNYTQYGATSSGSGSITLKSDGSAHTFDLDEHAMYELKVMADNLIKRRRDALLREIRQLEVLPAISYMDKVSAIDAEEIPF